jgi:hypothetical protein
VEEHDGHAVRGRSVDSPGSGITSSTKGVLYLNIAAGGGVTPGS